MDVFMTANRKSFSDFMRVYRPGDEQLLYLGKSVLSYALSNPSPDERYRIANFLLDKNATLGEVDTEGNTALHLLFGAVRHDPDRDAALARRLIDRGVSVATADRRGTVPFLWVLVMNGVSDEQLAPVYELWFAQPEPGFEYYSLQFEGDALDVARRYPHRAHITNRLEEYIHGRN